MSGLKDGPSADAERPSSPDQPNPLSDVPWPTRRSAYYSLFVITVVVMFTVLDRGVLSLLIEPMKHDFGISDTEAALLIGSAFSIPYGVVGLAVARFADRGNRRNVIAVSIAVWSFCTIISGTTQSYAGMLAARVGVGSGESSYGPAAWSIATDNWPREKVAFATGVMGIGAMVGTALSLFLGGAVLHFVTGMPPVAMPWGGVIRPWQWAFIVVGIPGLVWTLVVLTTKEPPRRGLKVGQKAKNVPVREVARWVLGDFRTYLAVLGGTAMKGLMMFAPLTWNATFLHRHWGWELSKAGMITGTIVLIYSPFAILAGAKLSEILTKRGRHDANLLIVFCGLLISVPFLVIAPMMPNPYLMLACNSVSSFIGTLGFGPSVAAFQVITPNRMRAQVGGLSQLLNFLLAWALAPLFVALFTDYLFRDPAKLGYSMMLNAIVTGIIALVITGQGLRRYARSYERAIREFAN